MIRSLWSGATGMIAQQTAVDTIANNIANVNTTGFKSSQTEFKSLLYQELQSKTTSANGDVKPINSQVGLGVRTSSITTVFTQGSFYETGSESAFAIGGKGFFGLLAENGEVQYTRNGRFNFSYDENTKTTHFCDSEGRHILDTDGKPIVFDGELVTSNLSISGDGEFFYTKEVEVPKKTTVINDQGEREVQYSTTEFTMEEQTESLGITIGLWQFNNPSGLEKLDSSRYAVSATSGESMNETTTRNLERSRIVQGYLEGSNVQLADEMVNLIVAQRAYEANSKAITTSDTMMEQANQLKR